MSAAWPVSPCCRKPVGPKARFCTSCGAELSAELREAAKALVLPPEPEVGPIHCLGCGAGLELKQVLEPVYKFLSGDRDDRAPRAAAPVDAHQGKAFLPALDALGAYTGSRNLTPPAVAALLQDPALAAYARVRRISRGEAWHKGGSLLSGLIVRDCPHCARPDAAGLLADLQAGEAVIARLPR